MDNIIGQEYVTDNEGTLEPVYEWVGEYCEG